MNKHVKHLNLCKSLNETYIKKNQDYGNSFGDMFQELGPITAVTRIGDKYGRVKSLIKSGSDIKVKDESIKDTLLDMANYCIMTILELEEYNDENRGVK